MRREVTLRKQSMLGEAFTFFSSPKPFQTHLFCEWRLFQLLYIIWTFTKRICNVYEIEFENEYCTRVWNPLHMKKHEGPPCYRMRNIKQLLDEAEQDIQK